MTSDQKRIVVLAGPASGRGQALSHANTAARRLREAGYQVAVAVGTDAADSAAQASAAVASGVDALIVAGGDGTIHLGLQHLATTDTPLGIVPAGTGNDFARDLGIPSEPDAAIGTLLTALHHPPRRIDLGRCGDRWFATVLASGFDSRVSERVNQLRWPRGKARYLLSVLVELGHFRPVPYVLDIDGHRVETEATLVAVGNTTSYGGGMRITPGASPDDGMLDVVVIPPLPRHRLITSFPRIFQGTHVDYPEVVTYRGRRITLSAPDLTAYADGEPLGLLPLTCEVVPGALQVLAPQVH